MNVGVHLYLKNESFEFEVDHHQFNLRLHHFHNFLSMLKKISRNPFHVVCLSAKIHILQRSELLNI